MHQDRSTRFRHMPSLLLACIAAAGACATPDEADTAADTPPAAAASMPDTLALDDVRAATERFQDVEVALAEGYIRDPMDVCEIAPMMGRPVEDGSMGIHYVRMDLLGVAGPPEGRVTGSGTHTDFLEPGVLIYEPQEDGSLELVAVENLVFREAWNAAGNTEPPTFRGRSFDLMVDDPATELDESHGFESHYDLHMWLYRENPRGMYAQFNPDVSCAHHASEHMHSD